MKFVTFERQGKLIIRRLKNIKGSVQTIAALPTLNEDQLQELLQYEEETRSKHSDFEKNLSRLLSTETIPDYDEDKATEIQDAISKLYISIQVTLKPLIKDHTEAVSSPSQAQSSNPSLKLPPLTLKTFNGSPEQWLSFHSLFESSVHKNVSLSETEKLQYLLTSVQGEPLNLVKNLPIIPENYSVAWDILQNRYKNNRKIIIHYVNHIIDLPPIINPNSKNIRAFISHFQENSQALLALKHDVKKNNIILSTLLLRKLDGDLRKKFEDSRADAQKIPEVQEIISFLESECTHMEAANLSQNVTSKANPDPSLPQYSGKQTSQGMKTIPSRQVRTVLISAANQVRTCVFCTKKGHVIYRCADFQALSSQDKHELVKKRQYCFNCLGTAHISKDCKSKNVCTHCGRKHHSWLHMPNRSPQNSAALSSMRK